MQLKLLKVIKENLKEIAHICLSHDFMMRIWLYTSSTKGIKKGGGNKIIKKKKNSIKLENNFFNFDNKKKKGRNNVL